MTRTRKNVSRNRTTRKNIEKDDYYYRMTSPIAYTIGTLTPEEMKRVPRISEEDRHARFIASVATPHTPSQIQKRREKLIKHLEKFNIE
jgi:hypothetical protein